MEDGEEKVRVLVGADFNARTGRRRMGENLEEEEGKEKSRDEKINRQGRKLCRFLEDREW